MAARDEKIYMPSGMGGLIRYTEEEEHLVKLEPKHIIGIVVGIVIFELLIKNLFA